MLESLYQIAVIVITVIASAVTVLKFFSLSTSATIWWRNLFTRLAAKRKSKRLKKAAIRFQIESIVNATVFDLQQELPRNWVKKMHLKWVDQGSIKELKRGQSIIRIEPEERQDYNIINGIYHYYQHCLFPSTYEVIPYSVANTLAVKLSQRTIENSDRKDFLLSKFNDTILEREIQKDTGLLKFFDPFRELDERGFLTGALIREIDSMAEKIRVKPDRNNFEQIILATMNHMIEFTERLKGGKGAVSEQEWEFDTGVHKYRFLLAKRMGKMKVDAHFNRVIEAWDSGVDRLYIFGANKDIPFTNKLMMRVDNQTSFTLVENFDLDRDFHSNKKGVGALFIRKD